MSDNLYMKIGAGGTSLPVKELVVTESMAQISIHAEAVTTAHPSTVGLGINDNIIAEGGFDSANSFLCFGPLKKISRRKPEMDYRLEMSDILDKAVTYFIASDTPNNPYKATNISAEALVNALLDMADLPAATLIGGATGFTFGSVTSVPINLIHVADYLEHIARITGRVIYYNVSASDIEFSSRKPYIVGGDVSEHTFQSGPSGDILSGSYDISDEKLRNRIVVYGRPGVSATASASSPYLPAGYFKTIVVSHELIDRNLEAQAAADLNLTMFNRLTETCKLTTIGKSSIHARDIVAVSDAFLGLTASTLWVVHTVKHVLGAAGYSLDLTLVR